MSIEQLPIWIVYLGTFLLGLSIGSFLNVVIARLPTRMEQEFASECADFCGTDSPPLKPQRFFGLDYLLWPSSHCPKCKTAIKAWQNIPVISYLLLKGKCGHCKAPISIRYPIVELSSALLSLLTIYLLGATPAGYFSLILVWGLMALTFIDIDHQLLPDNITLPLLWLGLFANLSFTFTDIESAIIGAISGYLVLWFIFQVFRLITDKEGMGYGDFKLYALFGAWLGWQMLPQILMIASVLGAVLGVLWISIKGRDKSLPIPFGPYLAVAGLIALFGGDEINRAYLQFAGIG